MFFSSLLRKFQLNILHSVQMNVHLPNYKTKDDAALKLTTKTKRNE